MAPYGIIILENINCNIMQFRANNMHFAFISISSSAALFGGTFQHKIGAVIG